MSEENKKIRTAVIGVGSMGQHHARIYSEISTLVGVVDFDLEQGNMVAKKYGVSFFPEITKILGKVDAASIVVPTKYHMEVAKELIENGVNVLIEKPLALNSSQTSVLCDLVSKSNVKVSVGHIERHNSVIDFVKKNIMEKKWGELLGLSARRFSPYPTRITDVGVIFDISIHDIDILNYLVGSHVNSVYCSGISKVRKDFEDNVNIFLEYNNGVKGLCQTSWLHPCKKRDLTLLTTDFLVEVDYLKQTVYIHKEDSNEVEEIVLDSKEPLHSELEDFLCSISKNRYPKTTVTDGAYAVEIAEACKESYQSGKVKKLSK